MNIVDDRYKILREIGRGGFGTVYKARQLQLDRVVAIKVLKTDVLLEHDGLARFEREARALSGLKHKNIVGCYGFGVWGQAPYMVLEFAEGVPLGELGKTDASHAVALMKQVFEALACAHGAGVVHRDMKPSNILVVGRGTDEESIKIIDFGLVKLMPGYGTPGQKLTETGYALGTCHYMAPEQALGGTVDQRADIYACGCIFYELITGRRPFEADDNVAIMFKHLHDQPDRIDEIQAPDKAYADAVVRVIENCLVKDANKRYQSCDEVLADLNCLQKGSPSRVVPRMVARVEKSTRNRRTSNSVKILIAAIAVLIGAVVAFNLMPARDTGSQSSIQVWHEVGRIPYQERWPKARRQGAEAILLIEKALELDKKDHELPTVTRLSCAVEVAEYYCVHEATAAEKEAHKDVVAYAFGIIKSSLGTTEARSLHVSPSLYLSLLGEWKGSDIALDEAQHYARSEFTPIFTRQLAMEYLCKGKNDKAKVLLQPARLIVMDESTPNERREEVQHCWSMLAAFDMTDGKTKEARELFERVVQCGRPGSPLCDAYTGLADLALKSKDYERALNFSKLAVDPKNYRQHNAQYPQRSSFPAYLIQMASAAALKRQTDFEAAKAGLIRNANILGGSEVSKLTVLEIEDAIPILRENGKEADYTEVEKLMRLRNAKLSK